MAHDAKGHPLRIGDKILIPCRVVQIEGGIYEGDNVVIETQASYPPQPGQAARKVKVAMNSRMLLRAEEGDDLAFKILEIADGEAWISPQ